jgi:hypothetical protein
MPEVIVSQMKTPTAALAASAHFLARRKPFAGFGFGEMVLSLDTQAKNGHYLFALKGPKVTGYIGWTMLDAAVAEDFANAGRTPSAAQSNGNDVAWLLVAASETRADLNAMLKAARARYRGKRVMGVRHKPNGKKVVFRSRIR